MTTEEAAAKWDEGFSFGYWLERGYSVDEAHARGVPDHLRAELGLEPPAWVGDGEEPDPVWNPYRATPPAR